MKQATFSELRNHAKQYFDFVEAGESVRIVRNGKTIADIVPLPQDLPSIKRQMQNVEQARAATVEKKLTD